MRSWVTRRSSTRTSRRSRSTKPRRGSRTRRAARCGRSRPTRWKSTRRTRRHGMALKVNKEYGHTIGGVHYALGAKVERIEPQPAIPPDDDNPEGVPAFKGNL